MKPKDDKALARVPTLSVVTDGAITRLQPVQVQPVQVTRADIKQAKTEVKLAGIQRKGATIKADLVEELNRIDANLDAMQRRAIDRGVYAHKAGAEIMGYRETMQSSEMRMFHERSIADQRIAVEHRNLKHQEVQYDAYIADINREQEYKDAEHDQRMQELTTPSAAKKREAETNEFYVQKAQHVVDSIIGGAVRTDPTNPYGGYAATVYFGATRRGVEQTLARRQAIESVAQKMQVDPLEHELASALGFQRQYEKLMEDWAADKRTAADAQREKDRLAAELHRDDAKTRAAEVLGSAFGGGGFDAGRDPLD